MHSEAHPFSTGGLFQACVDPEGRIWSFTIKPWNNGGPDKVVYILDKTGDVTTSS